MLPKSRIISVIVLGLGIALIAAGALAPVFLDLRAKLPLDAEHTTFSFSDQDGRAQTVSEEGIQSYEGPLAYQLHYDTVDPSGKEDASLRVGQTTVRGTEADAGDVENLVSAQVWNFPIDRVSGAAQGKARLNHTIASPAAEVAVDGYWLKFPSEAEKTTYPVFDPTLRQAEDAVFAEEQEIDGREIYRYDQEIAPVNVATLYAGMGNTTQFETPDGGTEPGYLFHSGKRSIYVDHATGMVVGMDLDIDDYYGTREGERREDVFVFQASTSDEDRAQLIEQAGQIPDPQAANIARWIGLGLGVVLTIIGLLGVFGVFGPRGQKVKRVL